MNFIYCIPNEYNGIIKESVKYIRQSVKALNESGYDITEKINKLKEKFLVRKPIEGTTSLAFEFKYICGNMQIEGEFLINKKSGRVRFYKIVDIYMYATDSFYSDLDTSSIR